MLYITIIWEDLFEYGVKTALSGEGESVFLCASDEGTVILDGLSIVVDTEQAHLLS